MASVFSSLPHRAGATQKTPKDPWDVSAHTMRVVTPEEADVFKMRSSCDKCHSGAERSAKGAQLMGVREDVLNKTHRALQGTAISKENLNKVLMDGSLGAHNPQKTLQLLESKKK